jgi:preprotein translocase subunit SecA
MERLMDTHIRDGALKKYLLHWNQHAYQTGKSTENAHHNVVTSTESAIEYKDIALGAFLDIM